MSRKLHGLHTGTPPQKEEPEVMHALQAHRVRSHDVPDLCLALSLQQNRTGNCTDAYNAWLSRSHQVRQSSVLPKAVQV